MTGIRDDPCGRCSQTSPPNIPLNRRSDPLPPPHRPTTTADMSLSSKATASLVRHTTRQQLPSLRSSACVQQKRNRADASTSHANFTSPFTRGTSSKQDTTVIPDFKKYRSGSSETGNKMFQYFMVGTMGGISALGAKNTVQGMSILLYTLLYWDIVTEEHNG